MTVDGVEKGVRQQVDPWSYYYRLGSLEIASNLPPGEHTATIELLARSAGPGRVHRIREESQPLHTGGFRGTRTPESWLALSTPYRVGQRDAALVGGVRRSCLY
ncbi:MAG: hypothetical protein A2V98_16625 [Planctomycetes bacterium RBG_16_64_12]|nr:MAG: hypothetical protein A2V98_16625 [Planctomycetes bacterium RBG_16_64_12]